MRTARSGPWRFALAAVAVLWAVTPLVPNVWYRMALFYAVSLPAAVTIVLIDWRPLLRPSWRLVAVGVIAAVGLYAFGGLGFAILRSTAPGLAGQAVSLYGWRDLVPDWLAIALMTAVIIPGEEVVWRGAVLVPLADRYGWWPGAILAAFVFAVAHLLFGSWLLLLAALAMGLVWNAMTLASRSLVPPLVCHLLWDVAVLFVWPYPV